MSEEFVLPIISVFGPLIIATIAAYMMLNRSHLDPRDRR